MGFSFLSHTATILARLHTDFKGCMELIFLQRGHRMKFVSGQNEKKNLSITVACQNMNNLCGLRLLRYFIVLKLRSILILFLVTFPIPIVVLHYLWNNLVYSYLFLIAVFFCFVFFCFFCFGQTGTCHACNANIIIIYIYLYQCFIISFLQFIDVYI